MRPVNSAGRFGLPVVSGDGDPARAPTGWESPPQDIDLTFHFHTDQLRELPETAKFPRSGDLRWRPMIDRDAGEGDVYIPLASLKDQTGRSWGDGIAYIEHRVSAPRGGKGLYVWMRMPDVVDRNQLLFELFRFAAEKSNPGDAGE